MNSCDGVWFYEDGIWELRTGAHWIDAHIEVGQGRFRGVFAAPHVPKNMLQGLHEIRRR